MTNAMKHFTFVLIALFLLTSCSVVNHLDEASTLQDYSREQDALAAMVRERDNNFERLLARIISGDKLLDLNSREALLARLGEPVLVTALEEGGVKKERWLYSHQKLSMNSSKVYFVINMNGGVDHWDKVDPPAAPNSSTNATEKK
jgi:hypothetical protein